MSHSFNETVTSMNFFRRLSRMSTRTASDHEKSSDRTSENEIQPVNSYDKEAVPVSLQTSRAQGQVVDLETQNTPALDKDAFGDDAHEQGVHYKTMSWWHAGLLMLAEIVSLGILSLPKAVATLGLVPGVLIIVFFGTLATYDGYVIGQFKIAYPSITNMADIGRIIGGRWLQVILWAGSILVLVFIQAAHVATFVIMMNTITDDKVCSVIWSVVSLVISIVASLPRTMHKTSYLSIASSLSIVAAVILTMIVIGINPPDAGGVVAFNSRPSNPEANVLAEKFVAVLNIVLSYAGHVAFPNFASELRDPRDFKKSVIMTVSVSSAFYALVAIVIYYYGGADVESPALSSIPPLFAKIAYGLAFPTIVVAGVVNGHVAAKITYIGLWQWRKKIAAIHERSLRSIGSWIGINSALWFIAWIIAESVPDFHVLLALVSALFSGWFSFGLTGVMWIYMNRSLLRVNNKKKLLTALNASIVCIGATVCVLGLYATGTELAHGKGGKPFSCESTTGK